MSARVDPLLATFDELEVGATFETRGRTVTEADVVAFAAYTGDAHPLHTDAEWARRSQFGERIAHGMLVVSYALGLVAFPAEHVAALRRLRDVVFKRPVRLGDTIHTCGRIVDKRALDADVGVVTVRADVRGADGRVHCRMQIDALWRRPRAAEGPIEEIAEGALDA